MEILKILPFLFIFLSSSSLLSQSVDWETLENAELKETEDFVKIDSLILKLINWLGNHHLDHKDRIKANSIFMKWMTGSPSVTVNLDNYLMSYTKKNGDFLLLYMAGWSKYVLENPDKKEDTFGGRMAGVNYFLDYYEKGKDSGVKKDRKVVKLLKKRKAGKLEKFIAQKIE